MIEPTALSVSGERMRAWYDFTGTAEQASERAEALVVEQTIEFPADLISDDDIRKHIIGRIEGSEAVGDDVVRVEVSYAAESTAFEFTQLLNVLFGNSSLLPDVKLVDVELPASLSAVLPGPRFGIDGLRNLVGVHDRPLVATALKPMGLSASRFAGMARDLALGGIDVIKDDHGISNQPFSPFEDRIPAVAAAVRDANARTGGNTLYMPTLNGPVGSLERRLRLALDAGVGGLLVIPGLTGWDHLRSVATDASVGVPIMGHPAFLGGFVSSPTGGIEHGLLFGTLARIAGADLSVFPTFGGRFSFSQEACRSIADHCRRQFGAMEPIFPAPAGGMTRDRIRTVAEFYGNETALLIGGDLHRGETLTKSAEQFVAAVS